MSDQPANVRIAPAGEAALLIALGDTISAATTDRVLRLTAALEAAQVPGVTDLAPGYVTVLVLFDPAIADAGALVTDLGRLAAGADETPLPPGKLVTIPVAYGGELGPDLADVAAYTGLSEEEVAARHAAVEYRVACPGFVPGWAYLGGLPPELATPRRASPRTRVPVGSVAIGGAQTGVYPFETPGGWNLIGISPIRLFDPGRTEPALLAPGDRVRFVPITADQYREIDRVVAHGRAPGHRSDSVEGARRAPLPADDPSGDPLVASPSIRVLAPGLLTTVQDLGRPGGMRHGIGREGAIDRAALILGNRLVGNQPGAAGLEITLVGPRLRFSASTVVAVTGADLGATLDGQSLPTWQPVLIPAAGELTFEPRRAAGHGARAFLCLAGGVDVPVVLGSRSTYLSIGIGGHDGRPLRAGDVLPIGRSPATPDALLHRRLAAPPPDYPTETVARVVLGPQMDRFTPNALKNLAAASYRASSRSDRMGLRLEAGPPLAHRHGADLISEGIVPGSIQVPGDGLPIVLLHACATAGGYPKVATVIGADLDRMGQVRPGDRVRFAAVAAPEARRLTLAYRAALGPAAVVDGARPFTGWTANTHAGNAATGAGIAALIDALGSTTEARVTVELRAGESRLALDIKGGPDTD